MRCAICPSDAGSAEYVLGGVRGHLCDTCGDGLHAAVSRWLSVRMAVLAAEQKRLAEEAKRDLRARERDYRKWERAEDERRRMEVRQANELAKRRRALQREAYPAGFYLSGTRAIEAGLEAAMAAEVEAAE